jgi:hypothetical protein
MMEFLGHRIADKRVLRYIKRFLMAGILEDEYLWKRKTALRKVVYAKLCISPLMQS